jgi:hypothetical protein
MSVCEGTADSRPPMSAPDLWVHALGDPEFGKISFDGMHYARVSREG